MKPLGLRHARARWLNPHPPPPPPYARNRCQAHLREKSFGSYVFGLRSVLDEWNNEARTKHSAVALKPLSYEAEARSMLEGLKLA